MSIKPITPKEATEEIEKNFPNFVIEGINNAINKHYFGKASFTIKQKVIADEIMAVAPEGVTREKLFEKHWMDFEKIYEKFGWNIKYDRPGYDENYDAFFEFKIKG